MALHVACGDITDIKIADGTLTITATDNTMLAILESGKREIERAISWQGLELVVEIKQLKKEISPQEADIKKLKVLVGDKLKIK